VFVVFFGQDEFLKNGVVDESWKSGRYIAVRIERCQPGILPACLFLIFTQLSAWCPSAFSTFHDVIGEDSYSK